MNKTQSVLEKVRHTKGLEHLLELSFGCEVECKHSRAKKSFAKKLGNESLRYRATGTLKVGSSKIQGMDLYDPYFYQHQGGFDREVTIVEIIGHPVQWSDVLVALQGVEGCDIDKVFTIGFSPNSIVFYFDGPSKAPTICDLTKTPEQNMNDNQELTTFLAELLGVE